MCGQQAMIGASTTMAFAALCMPTIAASLSSFRGSSFSTELGDMELAQRVAFDEEGSSSGQMFASLGVNALAKANCSADEALDMWKARGQITKRFIKHFQDAYPNGLIQVDTGAIGCIDYSQFEGRASAVPASRPMQMLTLVHHSAQDICLSDTQTRKMKDFRQLKMSLFSVKGEAAKLNAVRGYGVYWPPNNLCEQSPCPMVISLQGLSERAKYPKNIFDFRAMANSGLMRILQKDEKCSETLRSVLVFPQIIKVESWVKNGPSLLENYVVPLVHELVDKANGQIDESRIAITGYSEGAFTALQAAARYPSLFSMAISISASVKTWENMEFFQRTEEQAAAEAPESWKLKAVILALGDNDHSGDQPSNLANVAMFLGKAGLEDRVSTHVRLYAGLGHNHWEKVYNNWPALHEVIWHGDYSKLWGSDSDTSDRT